MAVVQESEGVGVPSLDLGDQFLDLPEEGVVLEGLEIHRLPRVQNVRRQPGVLDRRNGPLLPQP